jgi:ATP-binding cassette subfamily A (ABC1) protein 3
MTVNVGTILAILGHNGAGKTTAINILTGLLEPSSGEAFVLNRSIHTDLARLRQKFGVCPQHDILWPDLTPYEHLMMLCKLKNIPSYISTIRSLTYQV